MTGLNALWRARLVMAPIDGLFLAVTAGDSFRLMVGCGRAIEPCQIDDHRQKRCHDEQRDMSLVTGHSDILSSRPMALNTI